MTDKTLRQIIDSAMDFYTQSEDLPLSQYLSPKDLLEFIPTDLPVEPISEDVLQKFCDSYLKYATNTLHKGFSNQLWSKVDAASLAGEVVASVSNTSMYTFEVAPVATVLEHKMITHLNQMIWKNQGDGVMTSGGTASNLQALLCARNTHFPKAKRDGVKSLTPVILTSEASHYSVSRAANILGLGTNQCHKVKTNAQGQMDIQALSEAISAFKGEGKAPFCVVATAGTTVQGAYDPLDKIASICQQENLWFHVDGAYGASVLLSQKHRSLMSGIEFADSLSWDFHKAMGIHLPCAFLLLRQSHRLKKNTATGDDSYIFHDERETFPDLGPRSLQCGRRVDILKLWLTYLSLGREGMEKRIEKMFASAQLLAQMIQRNSHLTLLSEPESINVCFRYKSRSSSTDIEALIRESLRKDNRVLINYSSDDHGTFFRMAITRPDLEERDFEQIIDSIVKTGGQLEQPT